MCHVTNQSAVSKISRTKQCNGLSTSGTAEHRRNSNKFEYEYNVTCVFPVKPIEITLCSQEDLCATNKPVYYWTCSGDAYRESSEFSD